MRKIKFLKVLFVLLAIGIAGSAVADVIWTGAGTDDLWTNADNWQDSIVPAIDAGNISLNANNDAGNDLAIIDSSAVISLNNDFFGPEWGMTLDIDGGSLTVTNPNGFVFAPVADDAAHSVINVHNGGSLMFRNCCWVTTGGLPVILMSI